MSRTRNTILTLCTALMVATGLGTTTAAPASASTKHNYSNTTCTDILILAFRGSGQAAGPSQYVESAGAQVAAVADQFVNQLRSRSKKSVRLVAVDYPAVSVTSKLGANLMNGTYTASVNKGVSALHATAASLTKTCSKSKMLFIGYSQGGHVISQAMRTSYMGSNVLGTVAIADPTRQNADQVRFDGIDHTQPQFNKMGSLVTTGVMQNPVLTPNRSRMLTICDIYDRICNAGSIPGLGSHTTAYKTRDDSKIAAFAIHQMLKANRFQY